MKLLIVVLYFLNLIYMSLLPTLGYIAQGEQPDPDFAAWLNTTIEIAQWIFGIVLIALIVQSIKPSKKIMTVLITLLSGPIAAMLITIILQHDFMSFFFHNYLIVGASFCIFLLWTVFTRFSTGLKSHGPIGILPGIVVIILLIIGFYSTINLEYFRANYTSTLDMVALFGITTATTAWFARFLKQIEEEHKRQTNEPDRLNPIATMAMILGLLVWTVRYALI